MAPFSIAVGIMFSGRFKVGKNGRTCAPAIAYGAQLRIYGSVFSVGRIEVRQEDYKDGSHVPGTANLERPFVLGNNLLANPEPKARAGGNKCREERLKDALPHRVGHAGSGICHREADAGM